MRFPVRTLVCALLALLGSFAPALAARDGGQTAPAAEVRADGPARPRLCVLVAVDQMIPEQLERLAPWFEGGLARLAREGRVFRQAQLPYGVTETGPGHVTLATGRTPAVHGVIANDWIDPESGRSVYCVLDEDARYVTSEGPARRPGARSWRNVRVPALGDRLQSAFPGARVVSIAGKDRSAVGLGGAGGDAVLWWDKSAGGFQSSDAYCEELPPWALDWNAGWLERVPAAWEPLLDGPLAGSGTYRLGPDGAPAEDGRGVLPRPMPGAEEYANEAGRRAVLKRRATGVYESPFVDAFVLEMAELALAELALGSDPARVDLLALGLSACDVVGHAYGPYSYEVTDLLLRLDRGLGRLFERLDAALGADGWICVLSADHGVLELPEELARRGIGARRIQAREVAAALQHVAARLAEELGLPSAKLRREAGGLYLDRAELRAVGADPARARALARDALLEAAPWVARAWTREELVGAAGPLPADPWRTLAQASYDSARGPDVVYHLRPWHLVSDYAGGTSHGSPYYYDRRVPLVLRGPGVAPGTDHDPVTTLDVVPTVLAWLGLDVPAELEGRDLRD